MIQFGISRQSAVPEKPAFKVEPPLSTTRTDDASDTGIVASPSIVRFFCSCMYVEKFQEISDAGARAWTFAAFSTPKNSKLPKDVKGLRWTFRCSREKNVLIFPYKSINRRFCDAGCSKTFWKVVWFRQTEAAFFWSWKENTETFFKAFKKTFIDRKKEGRGARVKRRVHHGQADGWSNPRGGPVYQHN